MAELVVRNLDLRVVEALQQRAAKNGRSAEDEDFERVDDPIERDRVSD